MENRISFALLIIYLTFIQRYNSSHIVYKPDLKPSKNEKLSEELQDGKKGVVLQGIPPRPVVPKHNKNMCVHLKSHHWNNSFIDFIATRCMPSSTNATTFRLQDMNINITIKEIPQIYTQYHFKVKKFHTDPSKTSEQVEGETVVISKHTEVNTKNASANHTDPKKQNEQAEAETVLISKHSEVNMKNDTSNQTSIHAYFLHKFKSQMSMFHFPKISNFFHHATKQFFHLLSPPKHWIPEKYLLVEKTKPEKPLHRLIPKNKVPPKEIKSPKNKVLLKPIKSPQNKVPPKPINKKFPKRKLIARRQPTGKKMAWPPETLQTTDSLNSETNNPSPSSRNTRHKQPKLRTLHNTQPTNFLFTNGARFNRNFIPSPPSSHQELRTMTDPWLLVGPHEHQSQHLQRKQPRVKRGLQKFLGKSNDKAWMDPKGYQLIFNEYYKCLAKRVAEIRGTVGSTIKPVLLIVGQSVELKCDVCMRPDQNAAAKGIEWQMMRRADGVMKHVEYSKKSRMTMMKDYSLHISDTGIQDAGQYFCVVNKDYASVYQVDILLNEKRIIMHVDDEDVSPEPTLILDDRNLNVSTVWTDWSFCDRCGEMGSQRQLGLCMVKKLEQRHPIEPIDFPMIDFYPDGIPCHSTALPHFIKNIPSIKERASETLVRSCMQVCPTTPGPINITDKAGKVIEVLEPGFYSIHNPPTIPPITQRKVIYEDAGKHLILSCPKQLTNVITVWKRGTVVINPLTIKQITRNRVYLDQASRLHIRKLFIADTSTYLCFLRQRHVATFKVIVYEPLNQQLKDHISLIGMFLTCASTFVICLCLCCKKNKQTAK